MISFAFTNRLWTYFLDLPHFQVLPYQILNLRLPRPIDTNTICSHPSCFVSSILCIIVGCRSCTRLKMRCWKATGICGLSRRWNLEIFISSRGQKGVNRKKPIGCFLYEWWSSRCTFGKSPCPFAEWRDCLLIPCLASSLGEASYLPYVWSPKASAGHGAAEPRPFDPSTYYLWKSM